MLFWTDVVDILYVFVEFTMDKLIFLTSFACVMFMCLIGCGVNYLEENESIDDQDYFQRLNENDESDTLRAINKIRELAQKENIYDILVNSLAPSAYQMDNVKKGTLCQLTQLKGATKKEFGQKTQIDIILNGMDAMRY